MITSGTILRSRRQQLGLSQAKLAELCGISQHILSAFELEKTELPAEVLGTISIALEDKPRVNELVMRRKRYQDHAYADVDHVPERVRRAAQTKENQNYRDELAIIARQHVSEKSDLTALSLFSGCGGFSLGFSAAGFQLKGFLELEKELRAIYTLNFSDCVELGGDITQFSDADLVKLPKLIGRIDAIIGGPPCQGFSLSGKRRVDDSRNSLFRHYLRFVDAVKPKFAVLENVRLLTSMKNESGRLVKDDITTEFKRHGYTLGCFEVNAKNYGVPQHRERVLFLALREDLNVKAQLPDWTHAEIENDLFSDYRPCRTFGDACSDLKYLESGGQSEDPLHEAVKHPKHVINWLWDVPEGCSAHDNEDPAKRPPSGYNTTYKRQVWNEPASTVQTTFGMISGCRNVHPIATRSLTVREAARIQSFPDSYKFDGNVGAIRTGIGNAVPPLMAYCIGQYAANIIKSCKSTGLQG
jgi:DNA (cytosine-5)-methyltransferase 1